MAPPPRSPGSEEERGCGGGFSSDSDRDDALDEDLEALRRACIVTGASPGDLGGGAGSPGDDSSDSEDDLGLLRTIQKRFSAPLPAEGGDHLPIVRPLNSMLPSDSDSDDFETLRAIQRRFEHYENDATKRKYENCSDKAAPNATNAKAELGISGFLSANRIGKLLSQEYDASITRVTFSSISAVTSDDRGDVSVSSHQAEDRTCHLSSRTTMFCRFPNSAQTFMDALKRNRSCQKFIRTKLIEIEAKIERNKQLRERVKWLMDFQVASRKRMTRVLSHKDPRVRLISSCKLRTSNTLKASTRTPLQCGPPENSHVSKYRVVLSRFPISLCRQPWSQMEKENLAKGIKQQYQERVLLNIMELSSDLDVNIGNSAVGLRNNFEFSPVDIRSFLPMVNWERLASMYLPGHSGAECKARWLNTDDPLINHNPWTILEEKKLLHIVQNRGIYNWINIAILLGTQRTPFQCLAHYQRSLNPCILKKDWTKDEDAQLRAAVETFGEDNWQLVASNIEGRTGPQCSNRWRKSLHPIRQKVGRWSVDEDKRLKVAVILFGAKNWNKLAQFIPGRTQVQCRERWVNCLDPSLNLKAWSEEEDARLKEAISTYGYCWSKVASSVPPRTDNQCWRRWKVLFPDEVPLRQAAWKMQKAVLISNFVDRESERPSIGPNDFCLIPGLSSDADVHVNNDGARKKKSRNGQKSKNQIDSASSVCSRKCKAKGENFTENSTANNRLVSSRKSKAQVENSKEDATEGSQLEVVSHKTISKKRRKESSKQHIVLDQHEEHMLMSDDVFQLDAAARTCSDVTSLVDLQGSSSRRRKTKAKSPQQKLTRDGLEEPSVHKTILRKRKRKRPVNAQMSVVGLL